MKSEETEDNTIPLWMQEIVKDLPPTQEQSEAEEKLERQRERDKKERREARLLKNAQALLKGPEFFAEALQVFGRSGVVGEYNNLLVLMLAGVSRTLPHPASVMLRGSPSSGKSRMMKAALQLFDPEIVQDRAGMSPKALFHGEGSLAGQILALPEYHSGKDSRHLIRLAQTEGLLTDESTVSCGRWRTTSITERIGRPVVMTTTSELKIPVDDLSRFQIVWADESEAQTRRVLKSRTCAPPEPVDARELDVWRKATSLLVSKKKDFQQPPRWLRSLADQMPLGRVGIRRDFERFLTFLQAIALCCRYASRPEAVDIEFSDYVIAYLIFEPIFTAPSRAIADQDLELARTVARLNEEQNRPATVNEIAEALRWKPELVYKVVKSAVAQNLVAYEGGTRERNVKRLIARDPEGGRFLPHPLSILKGDPDLGGSVTYRNPFTGEKETIEVKKRGGGKIGGDAPSRCKHGVKLGDCRKCAGSSGDKPAQ